MDEKHIWLPLFGIIAVLGVAIVAKGYPDWAWAVYPYEGAVFNITGDVNITNAVLDVNVANSTLNITGDVNITNAVLDVNVTNPTLNVTVQGTAQVEIQNAEVDVNVTNSTLNVNVTNRELDVNVTNSTLNITGDVNITNAVLDVNVANSTLNVNVQGTAQVDIQNAEVNVKNLREQVAAPSDLKGFKNTRNVGSGGSVSVTVYTNNEGKTVFLEYLTTAVQGPANATVANTLSPLAVTWRVEIKDSRGTTLYEFFANGNLFMNFDPAIPVPAGGKIVVTMVNRSSEGMYMVVSGVVRTLTG